MDDASPNYGITFLRTMRDLALKAILDRYQRLERVDYDEMLEKNGAVEESLVWQIETPQRAWRSAWHSDGSIVEVLNLESQPETLFFRVPRAAQEDLIFTGFAAAADQIERLLSSLGELDERMLDLDALIVNCVEIGMAIGESQLDASIAVSEHTRVARREAAHRTNARHRARAQRVLAEFDRLRMSGLARFDALVKTAVAMEVSERQIERYLKQRRTDNRSSGCQ